MELVILAIYGLALTLILIYSIVQLNLVLNYRKYKKQDAGHYEADKFKEDELPYVTIQLPIYNEKYVTERLIDAIIKIDYPKDRLQIQVVDDSTDETVKIAAKKVKEYTEKGFDIEHFRRETRTGFKAGALAESLKSAKGEFIAIFDADFIPETDFLYKTLPYFKDDEIGMVQTPWGHINRDYSFLTRLQAFALDAHFTIEQTGRYAGNHFINFNGTGGIWRKECIMDAGGWQHDTLTEDLDLSYRAQLKGWKFVFTNNIQSPAELPVAMTAIKNQQFRWIKGGAENLMKSGRKVIVNKQVPLKTRIHGLIHLMSSSIFLCVFITAMLSIPTLFIKSFFPQYAWIFMVSSIFLISMVFLMIFYRTSFQEEYKSKWFSWSNFITRFFMFLSVSMGLSFHNTIAVLEGLLGKKSSFVRTPKFNILTKSDQWKNNVYLSRKINLVTIIEGLLSIYFLVGVISAFYLEDYGLLPFHTLLFLGFGTVFLNSVLHVRTSIIKS